MTRSDLLQSKAVPDGLPDDAAVRVAKALYAFDRRDNKDVMPPWSGARNARKIPYEDRAEAVVEALR